MSKVFIYLCFLLFQAHQFYFCRTSVCVYIYWMPRWSLCSVRRRPHQFAWLNHLWRRGLEMKLIEYVYGVHVPESTLYWIREEGGCWLDPWTRLSGVGKLEKNRRPRKKEKEADGSRRTIDRLLPAGSPRQLPPVILCRVTASDCTIIWNFLQPEVVT